MSEVIRVESHHHRTWWAHRITLAAFAVLPAAVTVAIWTQPVDVFDVRSEATGIVWLMYAAVAVVTTLGVVVSTRFTQRRAVAVAIPWVITAGLLVLTLALLSVREAPPTDYGPIFVVK
jgi:hypothetical protein